MNKIITNKLLFGTCGIPLTTPVTERTTEGGISHVHKLGLDAMELEFVHSVYIAIEKAHEIKEEAKKNNVVLTCHAPYFINLSAQEPKKVTASIKRIVHAATIADACGATSLTFHAGFYMGQDSQKVYNMVKKNLGIALRQVCDAELKIWIRPETTGKPSQFGELHELCNLSSELEQVLPCIDFAHLHARSNGKLNTYDEFHKILQEYETILGKAALKNMHIHLSGINYTNKGERNHLILEESDMNYKDLLKTLHEFSCEGVLINESPNVEVDALLLKRLFLEKFE